ncbi:MAG TPA: ABC transporter permease [Chloroflexota bacterium]|nr:ABC transporter permease [Chloroflexota bacterium]
MQYLARRLALSVLVLFGVSILIFTMVRLLPGDVIDMMIGTEGSMSASQQHTVREQFGLNDAWPVQYVRWMGGILQGNLGKSFRTQQEVLPLIAARLPTTIELAVLSIVVSSVIAIPLGVISALSRNGWTDFVARLLGLIGLSVPNFWLATILILAASFWFRWSPALIYVPPTQDPLTNLQQMLLPTISLAVFLTAIVMRMTRSTVLEVLGEDYVRTAYAKGLHEKAVLIRHVLRNALIPVVTIIGLQAGALLGGVVVIEQLFGLPGLGWMLLNGIYQRDYPVVQGTVLFFALVFALTNLLVDLTYAQLDPRIKYG